jgi:proline iminopeptidase
LSTRSAAKTSFGTRLSIRDVSLFVEVVGDGQPLALMHGGPGADHWSMLPLRRLSDQFKLVFYDHRCNGRSDGAAVSSMNWENLTADADALRRELGLDRWTVLGHSFGGMVALEYALRYPDRLSRLILLDTCADSRWQRQNAPDILAKRGYRPGTVKLARRFFNGQIAPWEMVPALMFGFGTAYYRHPHSPRVMLELVRERRAKARGEAFVFAANHLYEGWSVTDRLGEIDVPTLVMAGRDDFQFPPECQVELAAGIPDARLEIIERAGHNAQAERPLEVTQAIREFIAPDRNDRASGPDALR